MSGDEHTESDGVYGMARGLLSTIGGEEAAQEFDDAMDELGIDPGEAGSVAIGGMSIGMTLAEQRRAMREGGQEAHTEAPEEEGAEADAPALRVREVEDDGEIVGIRLLCSDPDATVHDCGDMVMVRTSEGPLTQELGFEVGEVETVDSEGITEVVIRPEWYGADVDEADDEDVEEAVDDAEDDE